MGFYAKYFFVSYQAWHGLLVLLAGTTTCNHFLIKRHDSKAQIYQGSEKAEPLQSFPPGGGSSFQKL